MVLTSDRIPTNSTMRMSCWNGLWRIIHHLISHPHSFCKSSVSIVFEMSSTLFPRAAGERRSRPSESRIGSRADYTRGQCSRGAFCDHLLSLGANHAVRESINRGVRISTNSISAVCLKLATDTRTARVITEHLLFKRAYNPIRFQAE